MTEGGGSSVRAHTRLDALAVIVEVVEQRIIVTVEDGARDSGQLGEDVTGRGSILATLEAGTELATRSKHIHVVGPDKRLWRDGRDGSAYSIVCYVVCCPGEVTCFFGQKALHFSFSS